MKNRMKIKILSFTILPLLLGACVNMVFDSARYATDEAHRGIWRHLAENGDVEAQYKLGTMLCCGQRPKFDNVEALYWWCKAAKSGQRDAQYAAGKMFEKANEYEGTIIPKDDSKAYVLYSVAARNGQIEAAKMKDALILRMQEEDIGQAEAMLEKWPNMECAVPRNLDLGNDKKNLIPEFRQNNEIEDFPTNKRN